MSLASDYAAAVAAGNTSVTTALANVPAPFNGPNGHMEVTTTGGLRAVPAPGVGTVEIPGAAVPAVITWLTATFVT
jgi:hypothetical protein